MVRSTLGNRCVYMRRFSLVPMTLLLASLAFVLGSAGVAAAVLDGSVERGTNTNGEGYLLFSLAALSDVTGVTVTMAAGTDYIAVFSADASVTAKPHPSERTSPWRLFDTRTYLEGGVAKPTAIFFASPVRRTHFLLVLARHFDNSGAPPPVYTGVDGMVVSDVPTLTSTLFNGFASPAFASQWAAGEAIAPNYWGPLSTARSGQQERYLDAFGGLRLVQYFDKGRMELADPPSGAITNGLLATELITGQLQKGDAIFEPHSLADIPIAGDPDNAGPTYAALGTNAARIFLPIPFRAGILVSLSVSASGAVATSDPITGTGPISLATYDNTTQHSLITAFATYREKVGLLTIGYAKSEPFRTTVRVAGVDQEVIIQVFERRVLTYTASNPDPFKVEMGNIGQHYYQWRYGPSVTAPSIGSVG